MVLSTFLLKTSLSKGQSGDPLNSPCVSPVIQKSDHTSNPYLSAASKNSSHGVTPPPHILTRLILAFRQRLHFIIIPQRIAVKHEIRHPGSSGQMDSPAVHIKITAPAAVYIHSFRGYSPDPKKKGCIIRQSRLTSKLKPYPVEVWLSIAIRPPDTGLADNKILSISPNSIQPGLVALLANRNIFCELE